MEPIEDLLAAFVEHGAPDARLVYDTCHEMYFQYAKIQAYIADFRKQMNLPEWLISLERLIDGSKAGRARKPKGRGHKRSGQPDQQVRLPNLFTAALS